ncbi:MAG: YbjQ family protein [Lachnospiraceae bacterium]|nr:YbjQ family protein [Lachnospiraceae bacterium]
MGKLICPICGRKQGSMIQSAFIFTGNNRYEICFECGQLVDLIRRADDFASVSEQRRILLNRMSLTEIDEDLKDYLMKYIEPEDSIKPKDIDSAIENEKKQKEEQEKEEILHKIEQNRRDIEQKRRNFLITTGFNFEGYSIKKYLGVVTNEALVGTGFFSELSNEVNDFFGLESLTNKSKLSQSKSTALYRLRDDAILEGANALIGVDFDIMTFSNNTIVTSVNGTAVWIEKDS